MIQTIQSIWTRRRSVVAVDIEGSTTRADPLKGLLRSALYDLLDRSLEGLAGQYDPLVDRGDGVLMLVRPIAGSPVSATLVDAVVPRMATLLAGHNQEHPDQSFRLRAVVHAGEVHYDRRGCFGETLDVAFRLLDAPEVKHALKVADAPMVLVISDDVHRAVRRGRGPASPPGHGQHGSDGSWPEPGPSSYEPLPSIRVGPRRHHGWVRALSPRVPVYAAG